MALTKNQLRSIERAAPEKRDALRAAYERDQAISVKIGLAKDGVDVGDGYHDLSAKYRVRV